MAWSLVRSGGEAHALEQLALWLPLLFATENRGKSYHPEATARWVAKVASAQASSFAELLEQHPELLDSTLLAREPLP